MTPFTHSRYLPAPSLFFGYRASFLRQMRGLLCVVCALLSGGCATRRSVEGRANAPDGKALYAVNCASCHGEDGRNDRQGANRAMRLKKANALSDKEWETLVQNGRGEMPAFHNRLSLQEIHALREYVYRLTNQ